MTPLLQVRNLTKEYRLRGKWGQHQRFAAVAGASLELKVGECLALVGESGSGKTTLALSMLGLLKVEAGQVFFDGVDLRQLSGAQLRRQRRHFQMVFQDSGKALNPRQRVGHQIAEPLAIHRLATPAERPRRVAELLDQVGLPASVAERFPHQLSGGQQQRVGIARALATGPRLLVLDEPVSALDVSVQAQILELLADLQQNLGLAMILVSHDLAVVEQLADRVLVMYLGRLVEDGPRQQLFSTPCHPYTASLLAAVPKPDPGAQQELAPPAGEAASFLNLPAGCAFHPRCPIARQQCREQRPELRPISEGRRVACHFAEELLHDQATEST